MNSISLFFPVYRDEETVSVVAQKAFDLLDSLHCTYEIIIVNDASPDRSGQIADELAREHESIRVIHHPENLGYGRAIRSGLNACRHDLICMIDGDDEYEVFDFLKLLKVVDHYDLIITFRYKKLYSTLRIFVSFVYNWVLRRLFRSPFRDISTGLRIVRRSILEDISLESTSPFVGAELAVKAMLKGYRVGEVGIQTFPSRFRKGDSVTPRNIISTILDMFRIYRKVFSDSYDLPPEHPRVRDG